jgi:hypothetical protein
LIVKFLDLKQGDSFVVKQQNSDTHILSETKPYVYEAEETIAKHKERQTKKTKKKHKKK